MSILVRADYGNKRVFFTIENATQRIRTGVREALNEIGKENVRFCKELIKRPPKTGRFYRFRGRMHRASAPGEAPANRSGDLLKSIHYRTYGWERMEFGDRVPYGKYLEDGTRRMAKRPHLRTTVEQKSRDNYNSLNRGVYARINRL